MTQVVDQIQQRRQDWVARVEALANEISQWAGAQGWRVERSSKTIEEDALGTYQVPTLHIIRPGGELVLNPVALHVIGSDGRVDLEAFPTLARVKLCGGGGGWRIMTDSNVPLRQPWDAKTFVQLADDLLS